MPAAPRFAHLPPVEVPATYIESSDSRAALHHGQPVLVDGSAAIGGPTVTGHFLSGPCEPVIDQKFFAGLNTAQAEVEDTTAPDLSDQIRIAGVINILSAAAALGAIEPPILIDRKQKVQLARRAALGLAPADALSGVLDDLGAGRYGLVCEHAPAVYPSGTNG